MKNGADTNSSSVDTMLLQEERQGIFYGDSFLDPLEVLMLAKRLLQVVIVDDETQITDLLRTFLLCISNTLDIHTFNDAAAAREHICEHVVDVLITDFKMPKYDGIQLMRAAQYDTVKILISGYVSEITQSQLQKLNAIFFEKPVPMKELGAIIEKAEMKL